MPTRLSTRKLQKGQTIIAVVALMLVSLIMGITISTNLTKHIRNITLRDDSSKAQAAAEAAIERILVVPDSTLEDYVKYGSCGGDCTWQVTDVNGQVISATVTLAYAGNTADMFETHLGTKETFQLNLSGFPTDKSVDVCWNTNSSIYANYLYENSSVYEIQPYAYNAVSTSYSANGFSASMGAHGYNNCFTVNTTNTPKGLRVRPFYADTTVYFIPSAGEALPIQGILINSTGTAGDAVRKVSVLKTSSTLPSIFDYALFQKSGSDPLSNVNL